jgi:hypothetical protein
MKKVIVLATIFAAAVVTTFGQSTKRITYPLIPQTVTMPDPSKVSVNAVENTNSPITITVNEATKPVVKKYYSTGTRRQPAPVIFQTTNNNYYYPQPQNPVPYQETTIRERNYVNDFFDTGLAKVILFTLLCGVLFAIIYRLTRPTSQNTTSPSSTPIHQTFNN